MGNKAITTVEELGQKKLDKVVNDGVSSIRLNVEFRWGKLISFVLSFLKSKPPASDIRADRT